jgi:hypothetical protein
MTQARPVPMCPATVSWLNSKTPLRNGLPELPPSRTASTFTTTLPAFVRPRGLPDRAQISAVPIREGSALSTLLFGFGPAILIIAFYVWMYRRMAQGGGIASTKPRTSWSRSSTS